MMNIHSLRNVALLLVAALLASCGGGDDDNSSSASKDDLHVASPDWSDQIIYFVMTDRFNDGDATNNIQSEDNSGQGYYRPEHPSYYSGGDLQGVTDRLDYIEGLGATALWITPPVANQWWDPKNSFSGYHGYWARDFKSVDEHYGNLEDYKNLSRGLHQRDMYLIQDIVPNHVGNFFTYNGTYDPIDTASSFSLIANNVPTQAPTQEPFNMNDRNNPAHFMANIFHWTPEILDQDSETQRFNYQVLKLDDLNTENDVVIEALKDSFGYWISEVGVDGFRVDTVKYIDHPFWNKFFHDDNGIEATARATGRNDFLYFGEVFNEPEPLLTDDTEQFLAYFEGTTDAPALKSLIGFPLYTEIRRVIGSGGLPSGHLAYRLQQHMTVYRNPYIVPNFIDNHDTGRFLSVSTMAGLRQALGVIMTIPGIPVIWQGTEQALLESRQSMFKGGHIGGNGRGTNDSDLFKTDSVLYKFIQSLAKIRTQDPVFTRGDLTILTQNDIGPGAIAWRRSLNDEHAFIIMNTSDRATLISNVATGIDTAGTILMLLSSQTQTEDIILGASGELTMELAAREMIIAKASSQTGTPTGSSATFTIAEDYTSATLPDEAPTLMGSYSQNNAQIRLIINGDLDNAIEFSAGADGAWSVALPENLYGLIARSHSYQVYVSADNFSSPVYSISTPGISFSNAPINVSDPRDDDNGPNGLYFYPSDDSYSPEGSPLKASDILNATVEYGGDTLRITLKMANISTIWGPPNGFDHTSIHIHFDLPDSQGSTIMVEQQSMTPTGFAWDLTQRTFGWGNLIYNSTGATATKRGVTVAGAPVIDADKENKTISFIYSGQSLDVDSWEGVSIYITTWDIDGLEDILRNIETAGAQWHFGGGQPTDPKIMDSVGPILIPVSSN